MLKTFLKKFAAVTSTTAILALGLSVPGQAATFNTTYYTFVWNGFTYKIPVYTEVQKTETYVPTTEEVAPKEETIDQTVVSEVQEVVNLVNAERKKMGLAPVKLNTDLSYMAKVKAEEMRDSNYFSHQSPIYGSPFEMMNSFGISYSYAGENIAAGQKTPEEVMKGWMNSPGHRANILNENYTEIGVGLAKGGSYGTYWVQEFIRQ